jgi:hypothetical protein
MVKKPTVLSKSQHAKFIEAAKAAETDNDPKRFADKVKKVASAPPPHQPMKKSKWQGARNEGCA